MSNLFDGVPEGTTHRNGCVLYKFTDDAVFIWSGGRWNYSAPPSAYDDGSMNEIIARPKPWSGPEDGLPLVGMDVLIEGRDEPVKVVGHVRENELVGIITQGADDWFYSHTDQVFSIKTPEQQDAEKRETAIRELMDIAQVDCRVTAARLVDAGFKREGV